MMRHLVPKLRLAIGIATGVALLALPTVGQADSARTPLTQGYVTQPGLAFCRAAIPAYCRLVEQRLQREGPFEAALAKEHRIHATIWFTALPDGRVVAALFRHGSGNPLIDQGLMNALEPMRAPVTTDTPQTFAMPVILQAVDNHPGVAFYIRLHRGG